MADAYPKLRNPPIVEAIVDFDCDVPPDKTLKTLEQAAKDTFHERYPDALPRYLQEVLVTADQQRLQRSLMAWMFRAQDGKQLVQVRQSGLSFNRLEPYPGFDACLPDIEAAWLRYRELVQPITLREIRLRYINRIVLSMDEIEKKKLDYFLAIETAPPEETRLVRSGFLTQYVASDPETHLQATVVLASQAPEGRQRPIMFDNTVVATGERDPSDWGELTAVLKLLRELKNRIFFKTVKPPCLEQFQ